MADLDVFNATPTQLAENLFRSSMRDAYGALHGADSEQAYRQGMARAIGGLCEGLQSLSIGIRATYLEIHKLNKKLEKIERSREIERFRRS